MRLSQPPSAVLVVAVITLGACKEITVPNYNNPNLDQLLNSPTASTVNTAIVGLVISLRDRVGTEASAMGILGKESYNLDQAEPRNVLGYLQGPIEPGGFVQDMSWTAGYSAFSFPLHAGFTGFSTPATFLQFNRGIKARTEVYRKQWALALTALSESFIDASPTASLSKGVYHVYSTASGDVTNPLFDPTPTRLYVHPSILNGAQLRANGQVDLRLSSKTAPGVSRVVQQVQGTSKFTIYPTSTTSVPILKNEELILLRAEARYQSGDAAGALADINFIRVNS